MRIIVIALSLAIGLIGFGVGVASTAEQGEKSSAKREISFQIGKYKHTYSGCLKDKCSVDAGQYIMVHTMEDTSLGEYRGKKNYRSSSYWYRLTGRTGDKTFNIESGTIRTSMLYGRPGGSSGNEPELQNVYFTAGDTVPLARSFYDGCYKADDQMIKLKMIDLKGNSLTHQVILPDCMKDIVAN
jgi:hypothetical protein